MEVSHSRNISPTKRMGVKRADVYDVYARGHSQRTEKAAKSKKRKKRSYDSSSDSDSEQEFWSSDTGLSRDKHIKLDKPNGVNL
jgi:hypothetical protein